MVVGLFYCDKINAVSDMTEHRTVLGHFCYKEDFKYELSEIS